MSLRNGDTIFINAGPVCWRCGYIYDPETGEPTKYQVENVADRGSDLCKRCLRDEGTK